MSRLRIRAPFWASVRSLPILVCVVFSCGCDRTASVKPEVEVIDLSSEEPMNDSEVDQRLAEIQAKRGAAIPPSDARRLVAELRRRYPFESIRERIPAVSQGGSRAKTVRLGPEAKQDLEDYEATNFRSARTHGDDVRPISLKLLHEEQVKDFVARDGNGYMRVPPPGAIHLALAEDPCINFDPAPDLSAEQRRGGSVALPGRTPPIHEILASHGSRRLDYQNSYDAYRDWCEKNNPLMMPDRGQLRYIHQQSHDSFLRADLIGYVKSVDAVAGFRGHQITMRPTVDTADSRWSLHSIRERMDESERETIDTSDPLTQPPRDAIWLLKELRLVSLLMHPSPAVYESDQLPRMSDLVRTRTVPLDAFEARSLPKLYAGEHLCVEPRLNEIRMLGAIRCSKTCIRCHQTQRGELLGAFTYTLTRRIPRD